MQAWLADEAFWTELDRYVDVFANEVYVSPLSWGVSGAARPQRAKRLNDYFQHMAVAPELAEGRVRTGDRARPLRRRRRWRLVQHGVEDLRQLGLAPRVLW